MQPAEIIQEIERLPLGKKFYVVEETIKAIKKDELNRQMEMAATELSEEYKANKDLIAFTSIDMEDFYEAK
jgi:hypothetical protein